MVFRHRLLVIISLLFGLSSYCSAENQLSIAYQFTPIEKFHFTNLLFTDTNPINVQSDSIFGLNSNYTYYFGKNRFFQPGLGAGFSADYFSHSILSNSTQYTNFSNCVGLNLNGNLAVSFRLNIHKNHKITYRQWLSYNYFFVQQGQKYISDCYHKVSGHTCIIGNELFYDYILHSFDKTKLSLNFGIIYGTPIFGRGTIDYLYQSNAAAYNYNYYIFGTSYFKLNIGLGFLF